MLLGLDIGTSSCKSALLDSTTGRIVASARCPLPYEYPDSIRAEISAESLWESVLQVLRRLHDEHPKEIAALRGMAVSIVYPTVLPVTADINPLANAILYNDRRSSDQTAEIISRLGEGTVEDITGNALIPGTSILPGILWFREKCPQLTRQTRYYITLGSFVIHCLTGVLGIDPSHASLSALCPKGHENQWSSKLLVAIGIDSRMLPPFHEGLTIAGTIRNDVAQQTGLPTNLPVSWSNGDSVLAAFGAGAANPKQVFAACGSTDNIIFCADRPSGNPLFCNVRHILPSVWAVSGSMSASGASFKWLCDKFLRCPVDIASSEAENAPSGSGGLVFLPYLLGERTPVWDAKAKGVFMGLSMSTGRGEAARAVMEGVACGWRQIIELMEKEFNVRPETIIAAGGGSTSNLWNQIKATMLKRPILALAFNDASCLGACLSAGLASGVFNSPEQAFEATATLRKATQYDPVPQWEESLESTYETYLQLYPAVKHLF